MNLSSPNGHIQGRANGVSNGDSRLQPIEEEREDSNDADRGIEVCIPLVYCFVECLIVA